MMLARTARVFTVVNLLLWEGEGYTSYSIPSINSYYRLSSLTITSTAVAARSSKGNYDDGEVNDDLDILRKNAKAINDFCIGTNRLWRSLVIPPVREYVEIRPAGTAGSDLFSKFVAPPEIPGIPRPVWLTILGSVPTGLGWYGYYKFCVEEELFQYELQNGKTVSGCGGYGTLFPFVYGVVIGFPLSLIPLPGSNLVLEAAIAWIVLGQINLYRRVNELCMRESLPELQSKLEGEPPLYCWWALLPPPLDVVVGLRQVHFLSEVWRLKRNEPYSKDIVAEELFPFISAPRFTLREFFLTPSLWFWFTREWSNFNFDLLRDRNERKQ